MNQRIGFGISAILHLSLLGAVVISWPDTLVEHKDKSLPFNLTMLQSVPTVKPEMVQAVEPASPKPIEPIQKIIKPVKQPLEKVVEKKLPIQKIIKKPKPKKVEKKLVKQKLAKKTPKKKPTEKPLHKVIAKKEVTVTVDSVSKTRPLVKQVLPTATEVTAVEVNSTRLLSIEDEFRQSLIRAITNNQFYPKRARRRQHEGVVQIAFTILSNGALDAVRVKSSSGYKSLDKAALKTVARLGQFKPIPRALNRQHWDFVVPLRYELL